ncbi:MAG: hypothetical protein M3083_03025 [Actinomycetota bacterium]|nr:hypothetical protein [Actinomycetota bacterium]
MPRSSVADRKATKDEVQPYAAKIRVLATAGGLSGPRLRDDGTLVVHSDEPGYRAITRLSAAASELVGRYVHVITDDVPGGADAQEL